MLGAIYISRFLDPHGGIFEVAGMQGVRCAHRNYEISKNMHPELNGNSGQIAR
jgi:hypothetical protein